MVSPCGSGKTVMFSYFAVQAAKKEKRILILAHRDELIEQISQTLSMFDVPHSFISAHRDYVPSVLVQVGSVFTVARRLNQMSPPYFIIVDEAHHAIKNSTWGKIFEAFPKAWKLGVTATAQRLGGEPLKNFFDDLIVGLTVKELISLGALCKYKLFAPPTLIDVSQLKLTAGDYVKAELASAADTLAVTGDAIEHYRRYADGKRAIAFCVSVGHAKHVASQFIEAEYTAVSIDGKLPMTTRRLIINDFRAGKIQILTSCDIVSEGFDLPAIECAIMLRPTRSLALWIQQSGRALRPYEGKEHAIILDHAGNYKRHGLPCDKIAWSLEGRAKKKKEDEQAVRTCPQCFAVFDPTDSINEDKRVFCPECGFIFPLIKRELEVFEGNLVQIDPEKDRDLREQIMALRLKRKEVGSCRDRDSLIALGIKRNYQYPQQWADHVLQAREKRRLIR